jgi:hypothetical protein
MTKQQTKSKYRIVQRFNRELKDQSISFWYEIQTIEKGFWGGLKWLPVCYESGTIRRFFSLDEAKAFIKNSEMLLPEDKVIYPND